MNLVWGIKNTRNSFPSCPVYYSTKQTSNDCRALLPCQTVTVLRYGVVQLTLSGPSLVFAPASFVFVLKLEENLFDRKA